MTGSRQARETSRRRVVGAAVLLSTSVLLGACGEANDDRRGQQPVQAALTHEQYQQEIQRILGSDDSRMASRLYFDTVATAYATDECSAKVRQFHDHLRSIIRQVEGLEPPPDVDDVQREFLGEAQESVRLVGVAADDVSTGELRCGRPLNERIFGMPSTTRAEAALAKLEDRGYFIFGD